VNLSHNFSSIHEHEIRSDVSALGDVHTLYLSGCQGISDVSA
jgi:hypothetical protein